MFTDRASVVVQGKPNRRLRYFIFNLIYPMDVNEMKEMVKVLLEETYPHGFNLIEMRYTILNEGGSNDQIFLS